MKVVTSVSNDYNLRIKFGIAFNRIIQKYIVSEIFASMLIKSEHLFF
jgi:hypothetical protein